MGAVPHHCMPPSWWVRGTRTQHCLRTRLHSKCSGTAFKMCQHYIHAFGHWDQYPWAAATLPSKSGSTACIMRGLTAALHLDRDTAFAMRQHSLQTAATPPLDKATLPSDCNGRALRMRHPYLQTAVALFLDGYNTACGHWEHCPWAAVTLPSESGSTAVHCYLPVNGSSAVFGQ